MAKSAKRKTDRPLTTVSDRPSKSRPNRAAHETGIDIASRAYDIYLARGREHGHDVNDWLQAERELQTTSTQGIA